MSIFGAIWGVFKKIGGFFVSERGKAALQLISRMVPQVAPIVAALSILDPKTANATDVIALYQKFQVTVTEVKNDPVAIANALLNLATELAKRENPGIATSILQSAIQLALVSLKNK